MNPVTHTNRLSRALVQTDPTPLAFSLSRSYFKITGSEFEMEADPGAAKAYKATCYLDDQGHFIIKRSYKDGSGPTELVTR